jgi:hypothetical protein
MVDDEDDRADDADADPIDALPSNADWPKRTKDTMANLDPDKASAKRSDNSGERVSSKRSIKRKPKLVGDGWELWLDEDYLGWEFSGEPYDICKMVSDEFPNRRVNQEYDEKHIITCGTRFGPLWEDVLEFLRERGIKARGVHLPKMGGERGPYDDSNPPPAE